MQIRRRCLQSLHAFTRSIGLPRGEGGLRCDGRVEFVSGSSRTALLPQKPVEPASKLILSAEVRPLHPSLSQVPLCGMRGSLLPFERTGRADGDSPSADDHEAAI